MARISYATSGGVDIAYQVIGEGEQDLVFLAGWLSHIELAWDEPGLARLIERWAMHVRLIMLDMRGTGLSERLSDSDLPTTDERMDDIRAVMDAAGSSSASVMAIHAAGPLAILFAAAHPERVRSLILYGTWACGTATDDYPWAPDESFHERVDAAIGERWGTGMGARVMAPSRSGDPAFREWFARYERQGASPNAARRMAAISAQTDVRPVVASVSAPTLVIHRRGDRVVDRGNATWLAEHIPGARLVELNSDDHWIGTDPDQVVDVAAPFVTGRAAAPVARERVLATVLVNDIVGSTDRASALGDQRWRELLSAIQRAAATEIERYDGRLVKSTGDGVLATFDAPTRGVRCAHALASAGRALGVELRTGIPTGEIELLGDDIAGIAVHIAARVGAMAGAGEVLVTSTVKDLTAGSGIVVEDRGMQE